MSAATSPGTGSGLRPAAGLRRLGHPLLVLRHDLRPARRAAAGKAWGPKPAISDQAGIEADLEASPWEGEGYRKVWARLRVCRDIRVARKPPPDARPALAPSLPPPWRHPHDGEIITHAPNLMWGTDGVRVFTVDDGWGWIFTAVEHWNAECVGWHVCKRGDRFAALQPIGACRAVWLDRGRRGSGAGLADGSRLSICRTSSGAAVLRLRSPSGSIAR